MFKYAITDMIEKSIKQGEKRGERRGERRGIALGMNEGLSKGMSKGRMLEAVENIIRNLDAGFSPESIAYWLNKSEDFVKQVEELHRRYPDADGERLVEYYDKKVMMQ